MKDTLMYDKYTKYTKQFVCLSSQDSSVGSTVEWGVHSVEPREGRKRVRQICSLVSFQYFSLLHSNISLLSEAN